MSGVFTEALSGVMSSSSPARFIGSQYAGLQVNQLMFTVKLSPASGKSWDVDCLKQILVSCNFRRKDADSLQLIDNCRLYDLFCFSDFFQGVSMSLMSQIQPKTSAVTFSGSVGLGYFLLSPDESVELMVVGKPDSIADYTSIDLDFRWVYIADISQKIYGFKSFKSVGGEQAYRDVLSLFYLGPGTNDNCTIRDYNGSQSVNLSDAVSLANAVGKFEYFTDFGLVYSDPTQFTQDISITLATGKDLFVQIEFFQENKLFEQNSRTTKNLESVLQNIYASRPEKFEVIKARGQVPAGFQPMGA
jgi:hypothetical protein